MSSPQPNAHTTSTGGRVNVALNYTQKMGIRTYGSYPYTGGQGTCQGPDPAFAYSAGPTFVSPCDERHLLKALYWFGPTAVSVKADCPVRGVSRPFFHFQVPRTDRLPHTTHTRVDHTGVHGVRKWHLHARP